MALTSTRLDLGLPPLGEDELAFLEGDARGARLADLPTVDGLDDEAYLEAVSRGLRSLLDRKLITSAGEPERPPELVPTVETIVETRALPALVVVAEQVNGQERRSRYVYGNEPGVVLLESPDTNGSHEFRMCAASVAAVRLAGFVDPDGRARRDGGLLESTHEIELAVGAAETLTRLFAVRRADPDERAEWEATIAASPSGLWLVGEDGAAVAGTALSPESCVLLLERLLDPSIS